MPTHRLMREAFSGTYQFSRYERFHERSRRVEWVRQTLRRDKHYICTWLYKRCLKASNLSRIYLKCLALNCFNFRLLTRLLTVLNILYFCVLTFETCIKTRPLFCIFLSHVLTFSQLFPTMFKPGGKFTQVNHSGRYFQNTEGVILYRESFSFPCKVTPMKKSTFPFQLCFCRWRSPPWIAAAVRLINGVRINSPFNPQSHKVTSFLNPVLDHGSILSDSGCLFLQKVWLFHPTLSSRAGQLRAADPSSNTTFSLTSDLWWDSMMCL